jgi:23S rRNA (guanosine2251-2'-O)-methyltransferase
MTQHDRRRTEAARGSQDADVGARDATWVFGPARVEETLQGIPNQVRRVLVRTGPLQARQQALLKTARARGVPLQRVPNRHLERIAAGARHQGAACEVSPVRWLSLGELLSMDPKPSRLLLLDRIEDPRNFGALVRAADGAGVDAVLVPRRGAAPPSPVAIAASAGAIARARLVRIPGAANALRALKASGYWTVGLTPRARIRWHEFDWTQPTVLVVGSEGRGLAAGVSKECEVLVSLPQLGSVRSLNVSVATGIVLYETVRQRGLDKSSAPAEPGRGPKPRIRS